MTPVKRLTDTYGKSSQRLRPGTEGTGWEAKSANWVWLKDVVVERPIVTWEEFLMVQGRLDRNKALALANARSKHLYLLCGMVMCQLCGATYMGKTYQKKYVYYMCGRCRKRVKGAPRCTNRTIPGKELEEKVWQEVSTFLSSPETVMAELHRRASTLSESGEMLAKEVSNLIKDKP
jgi:hypothetical protein